MTTSWQFDKDNTGGRVGWNSSNITHFLDNRLRSLTREIIQNSLDNPDPASAFDKSTPPPVIVSFKESSIKRKLIPGIDELTQRLESCLENAQDKETEERKAEIQKALECARAPKIPILEISDSNTSGMVGPCEDGKPFHTYLKTEGVSIEPGRAGSHGLGKAAPLANSLLRTIFVSTHWQDSNDFRFLCQGRATLMTHAINNEAFAPIGFWGEKDFMPVDNLDVQYNWLGRNQTNPKTGTSIFIIGWSADRTWKKLIVGHAITSFFAAFARKKLILKIDGYKHKDITHENIEQLMSEKSLLSCLRNDSSDTEEDLIESSFFLKALQDKNSITKERQTSKLPGHIKCKVFIGEDAPKKIAFIRNDILITKQIPYFWKNVSSEFKDFAGVYECLNDEGKEMLRLMEPPEHNDLSPGYLSIDQKENGEKLLKNLGKKLKEIIREIVAPQVENEQQLKSLSKYLSDVDDDGDEFDDWKTEINPEGNFTLHPISSILKSRPPARPPSPPVPPEPTPNPIPIETGPEIVPDPPPLKPSINIRKQRFVKKDNGMIKVIFIPDRVGEIYLLVQEIGADITRNVAITGFSSSNGKLENGILKIKIEKLAETKIDLKFANQITGGLFLVST